MQKKYLRLDLSNHVEIHPVFHVIYTTPYKEYCSDLALPISERLDSVPMAGEEENVFESILKHRKRGSGYQFLTLVKRMPNHEAEWQPTRDFVNRGDTITEL